MPCFFFGENRVFVKENLVDTCVKVQTNKFEELIIYLGYKQKNPPEVWKPSEGNSLKYPERDLNPHNREVTGF